MDSDIRSANKQTRAAQKKSNQEVFRTPEEVAAEQDFAGPTGPSELPHLEKPQPPKTSWRQRLALHWPPGKKEWITAAVVVLLVTSGVGLALTHHTSHPLAKAQPTKKAVKKASKQPSTVASTLSGLPVDPSVNQRPVTGVMIENSTDARPQAGLSQASVVFEAIAEGGITRFLALYQDTAPDNIGPVRSVRPYYELWDLGFDAGLAHVGGSPEALADIKAWNVRDLDQFYNAGAYHRITSRAAPHNVYTSIAALNQLEAGKGYTSSKFTGFPRKTDAPSKAPNAKSIDLTLSGPLYNVHYDYVASSNSYARSEAGAPHIDANTNAQISPKVVVALVMPYSLEADGYHSDYSTIGSGPAYFFQDGNVTTGQWAKSSGYSQFTFTDGSGKPVKLNPGQTWLTAVSGTNRVNYTP
ncbi:MAG TPA: DUF3048 domain-containing protein [Verrucomicrobiae bacterium]|nr:DUF3048 domain-containing protein [Verrucomicrobiae bacterium]